MRITAGIISLALAILPVSATYADDAVIKVDIPGHGTYRIGTASDHGISKLVFASSSGFSQYAMGTDAGLISFVGGKDFQPSASEYILDVSQIISVNPNMQTNHLNASGQCVMRQSEAGDIVFSVECHAVTDIGDAEMTYKGNGKKVTISHGISNK
ncbi:hypothetical protein QA646_17850 [Rhizobium sp. CB3090]|uniref:hypothetical protein n=1 Tax=Rhizobium sp. CB3090 TaxID=3039156 RepID=UPI0024B1094B|nr:hypothetical protein [Rhizobium sp. CB3090]WFU09110.1 hypothetical protein QA646_17850 [Rhizobium sp. CB3090]